MEYPKIVEERINRRFGNVAVKQVGLPTCYDGVKALAFVPVGFHQAEPTIITLTTEEWDAYQADRSAWAAQSTDLRTLIESLPLDMQFYNCNTGRGTTVKEMEQGYNWNPVRMEVTAETAKRRIFTEFITLFVEV